MTNVIPLFPKQKSLVLTSDGTLENPPPLAPGLANQVTNRTSDFESVMKKNKETAERLRRERNQANKNVLKSYRIK